MNWLASTPASGGSPPPCQPYCVRGARRDLDDPRARSLLRLMDILAAISDNLLPLHLALENVEGFARSQARGRLLPLLKSRGYRVHERLLCPTELGVPSRRPRFYLTASRFPFKPPVATDIQGLRPLADYLETFPANETLQALFLPGPFLARFGKGLRILDPDNPAAYTTCFTSGYGKSIMRSGSYLRRDNGVRYLAPEEVARLLHLPAGFLFPEGISLRRKWHYLGNSLSVIAVRHVLGSFADVLDDDRPTACCK